MPELPEVETVRCQLAGALVGASFEAIEAAEPGMLRDCEVRDLVSGLPGRRIEAVDRLGKFLIVRLSDTACLTLHLGMTGQLLVDPTITGAHSRFVFRLTHEDGGRRIMEFRDIRKFGSVQLSQGGPAPRLRSLGPDAWRGAWDKGYLEERLRGRSTPLKAFLLDQRHLAGIGNIYADEILWWTGLSPLRQAGSVSRAEVALLAEEIPRRLGEGVRLLGCSFSDFIDTRGQQGDFQNWLRAYGKRGESCGRCGGEFVRVVVGGRGTTYCRGCQK